MLSESIAMAALRTNWMPDAPPTKFIIEIKKEIKQIKKNNKDIFRKRDKKRKPSSR
jgi:hypothetical protein